MGGVIELWQLKRNESDVRVAGVCSSLAQIWRVDPLLVRILAIVLALSHGVGLVAYALLWWGTPRASRSVPPAVEVMPSLAKLSRPVIVIIAIMAAFAIGSTIGSVTPFGFEAPIVIGAIVLWGHRQQRMTDRQEPSTPTSTEFHTQVHAWQQRIAEVEAQQRTTDPPFPLYQPALTPTQAPSADVAPEVTHRIAPPEPSKRPWWGALMTILALAGSMAVIAMLLVLGYAGQQPWPRLVLAGSGAVAVVMGSCTLLASFARRTTILTVASLACVVLLFTLFHTLA